eukprot:Amastigsp_a15116_2.p3 type:complete len:116 gc:universal Amastigsp_a15116_2:37-384(+)
MLTSRASRVRPSTATWSRSTSSSPGLGSPRSQWCSSAATTRRPTICSSSTMADGWRRISTPSALRALYSSGGSASAVSRASSRALTTTKVTTSVCPMTIGRLRPRIISDRPTWSK